MDTPHNDGDFDPTVGEDLLYNGKGGKGKQGKGKQNSGGGFAGNCNYCGKWGHRRA